jgi:hypothetical protein
MRNLCIVSAFVEAGAGLALLGCPTFAVNLLLGELLLSPSALTVARVGGAGLLALAVACWFSRDDSRSRSAKGLVTAMLLYNVAAFAILAYAGLGLGLNGEFLWLGVALHAAMAVWCIVCLAQSAVRKVGHPRAIEISTSSTMNKE